MRVQNSDDELPCILRRRATYILDWRVDVLPGMKLATQSEISDYVHV